MYPTGSRIKHLREARNWSQLEFAEMAGMNNSVLSRIESNKRPIDSEELRKFSDILGVSTDHLVGKNETSYFPQNLIEEAADIFASLSKADQTHLLFFMRNVLKK